MKEKIYISDFGGVLKFVLWVNIISTLFGLAIIVLSFMGYLLSME